MVWYKASVLLILLETHFIFNIMKFKLNIPLNIEFVQFNGRFSKIFPHVGIAGTFYINSASLKL